MNNSGGRAAVERAVATREDNDGASMNTRLVHGLAVAGLLVLASAVPALSQESSMTCRLFPLACPGPAPEKPQPLLGTPEEQAQAPSPSAPVKGKHRPRKHASRSTAQ